MNSKLLTIKNICSKYSRQRVSILKSNISVKDLIQNPKSFGRGKTVVVIKDKIFLQVIEIQIMRKYNISSTKLR